MTQHVDCCFTAATTKQYLESYAVIPCRCKSASVGHLARSWKAKQKQPTRANPRFSQTVPSKPDAPPGTFLGPIQVPILKQRLCWAPEKVPVNVSLGKIPAVETQLKSLRVPTKDVHVCMHVFVFICFCACVCMPACAHMEGGLVCLKR